ncbi:DUF5309 family protein [Sulfurimonas sp. HSL-1656]|uniref:SU10 major capsid protein n=1 Tax=Thiomicrolovo subterrani TaxID=3131934 RepID=UPI0031F81891
MAITSTGYQAPATSREGIKPSVHDAVIQIGATETPITSKVGKSKAKGIEHSWIIDPIADPTRSPQLEIADFTGDAESTKQKRTNAVEIVTTEVMVSRDMMAVATYGGNEMAYEVAKKAKEHALKLEYMKYGLGRDADPRVSVFMAPQIRTEVLAGEMAGLFYYLAKGDATFGATTAGRRGNVFAFDTGGAGGDYTWASDGMAATLTEDRMNTVLQSIYDAGETVKDIYVGANLKKAFNGFVTRQLGNENKAVRNVVSLETDFGTINIRLSRFLSDKYGLGDAFIAGNFDYLKDAPLVETNLEDVPTSKTAKAKRYYTSTTMEVRNADAFAIGVGLTA